MSIDLEREKAPGVWGVTQEQLRVSLLTVTGQAFAGILIGSSPYAIVVRQDSGLEILFAKGSLVYVCPAPRQSQSQ